jgi:hypothetical protein
MSNDDSFIQSGAGGTTFAGPDSVALYRATVLRSALQLYARTGMKPNRAYTPTRMLRTAEAITHKKYKRGEYQRAANDLKIWCDTMSAALPKISD